MTPTLTAPSAGGLPKEMLILEPVSMVNMKQIESKDEDPLLGISDLHILQLSNLDQLFADLYISVCLFYDVQCNKGDNGCKGDNAPVKSLQSALEELLVHYPAAAGRVCNSETEPGRLEIHYYSAPSCHTSSGNGVQFVVAHANIALTELGDVSLPHPSLDLLYPRMSSTQNQDSTGKYLPRPVMAIQVTSFTCGGFTLAHMCSHAFLDGYGAATFLQNLCSIARGRGLTLQPLDILSSRREVMKPRMPPSPTMCHSSSIQTRQRGEAYCGKEQLPAYGDATRFAFSTDALEALRLRASGHPNQASLKCSRYQALAALLWTARAKSLVANSSSRLPGGQELPLRFPMNLRERGVPGLTRGYIGNAIFLFTVSATLQELCESPLPYVVTKIKSALAAMDIPECVQSLTDYIELQLRAGLVPSLYQNNIGMPSHVSLPFYDTDCGWGRPIYYGRPSTQAAKRFIILDHPAAGAWNVLVVFNSKEEQAVFQEEIAEYIC